MKASTRKHGASLFKTRRKEVAWILIACLVFTMSSFYGFADDAGETEIVQQSPLEEQPPVPEVIPPEPEIQPHAADVQLSDPDDQETIPVDEPPAVDNTQVPTDPVTEEPEATQSAETPPEDGVVSLLGEAPVDDGVMGALAEDISTKIKIENVVITRNGTVIPSGSTATLNDKDMFKIELDWSFIPSGTKQYIEDGDTARIEIAAGMPLENKRMTGKIYDTDGVTEIGEYVLNPYRSGTSGPLDIGVFELKFYDKLDGKENVKGELWASTYIEYTATTDFEEIVGPYSETKNYTFNFTPKNVTNGDIAKTVSPTSSTGNALTSINWQIDVNKALKPDKTTKQIIDQIQIPTSSYLKHTFDKSSVEVYKLDVNMATGALTRVNPPLQLGTDYTIAYQNQIATDGIDEDTMIITLNGNEPLNGQAYRVVYKTIPDPTTIASTTSARYYSNKASLDANRFSTASFTWKYDSGVTPPPPEPPTPPVKEFKYSKSGSYKKDATGNDYIEWTIKLNTQNAEPPDAWITVADTFGSGYGPATNFQLYLTVGGQRIGSGAYAGNKWGAGPSTATHSYINNDPASFDFTQPIDTGFRFELKSDPRENGSYYGYDIVYQTPIDFTSTHTGPYSNGLTVEGDGVGVPDVSKPSPTPPTLNKSSVGNPKFDSGSNTKGELSWRTVITPYAETIGPNLVITDTFSYSGDSKSTTDFSMLLSDDLSDFSITLGSSTLSRIADNTDPVPDPNQYSIVDSGTGGFKIVFHPDFVIKGDLLTINYKTKFDLSGLVESDGTYPFSNYRFINNISATPILKDSDDQSVDLSNVASNGSKEGSLSNGNITWTIHANTNGASFVDYDDSGDVPTGGFVMDDTFPRGTMSGGVRTGLVKYAEGTLKVYRGSNTTALVEGTDYILSFKPSTLGSSYPDEGFILTILEPGSDTFKVVYDTHLYGQPASAGYGYSNNYVNTVKFNNGISVTAGVRNTTTTMFSKDGKVNNRDDNTLDWTLTVNSARTLIENPVITDTLKPGQIFNINSVVVTRNDRVPGTVLKLKDSDGVGDYSVEVDTYSVKDTTTVKITFDENYVFDDPHTVRYSSTINFDTLQVVGNQFQVSNQATLKGDFINTVPVQKNIQHRWSASGATGSGVSYPVRIAKVDADDQTLLPGAVFEIEKLSPDDPNFESFQLTSGSDANLGYTPQFYLKQGTYKITEISPPDGYVIGPENSKVVTISQAELANHGGSEFLFTFEDPTSNGIVYDAALRKWISNVKHLDNNVETHQSNYSDPGQRPSSPVPVKKGDIVTFSIKLFNQCAEIVKLPVITDYLPAGYEFDPLLNPADDFGGTWSAGTLSSGITPITYSRGSNEPITLGPLSFTTIKLVVRVSNDAEESNLINFAEISEMTDEEGTIVQDVDSIPDNNPSNDGNAKDNVVDENQVSPGDDPRDIDPNKDQDDHDFAEATLSEYYDAALRKWVSDVERESDPLGAPGNFDVQVYPGGFPDPLENGVGSILVNRGDRVTFTIKLFNQCLQQEIITEVTDYLPAGYDIDTTLTDNAGWEIVDTLSEGRTLIKYTPPVIQSPIDTSITAPGILLQPGGSAEINLVVTVNGDANKDNLLNFAEISGFTDAEFNPGVVDVDSIPDNDPDNDGNAKDNVVSEKQVTPNGEIDSSKDQDDHDFADVMLDIKEYDAALRKWVSEVRRGGMSVHGLIGDPGQNPSAPLLVKKGDKVTFSIKLFSQCITPFMITKVSDYMPEGYTFDPNDIGNEDWTAAPAYDPETDFDPDHPYDGRRLLTYEPVGGLYFSQGGEHVVNLVLTVNADATQDNLRNYAEITEMKDEYGVGTVEDIDSTPDDDLYNDGDSKDNIVDEHYEDVDRNKDESQDSDDLDFADLVLDDRVFDAALRKWVSAVDRNGNQVASYLDPGEGSSTVPRVNIGDHVTFTIKVFNQCAEVIRIAEISDYLPEGYEFIDDQSINPGWSYTKDLSDDRVLLTYTPSTPIQLGVGEDSSVTLVVKVSDDATNGNLVNHAEITRMTDTKDETVDDVDSWPDDDPGNDGETKDNIIWEERKDGDDIDNDQDEDDEDLAEVEIEDRVFDAALRKWVSSVIRDGNVVGDPYPEPIGVPSEAPVVIIGDKVEFSIKVYNQCDYVLKIPVISDYMPAGYTFDPSENPNWTLKGDILEYAPPLPIRLAPEGDVNDNDNATVKLVLNVNEQATTDNLKNVAEITRMTNDEDVDVEDVDSWPDDKPNNDGEPKDNVTDEKRKDENGDEDEDQDEDDHDFADVKLIEPFISAQVDKDTIIRTSAAYVSLPGQEDINNVGEEQYRYDVNARAMSNIPATDFVIKDPLENVKNGQVKVDKIWTPIVWGDKDGLFDVYYATASDSTVRPWLEYQGLSTTARHGLTPPAGDLLTHVEFRYGDIEVGFTSKIDKSVSSNKEHRTNSSSPDGSTVKLPDGTRNSDKIESFSSTLSYQSAVDIALQSSTNSVLNNDYSFSPLATGISGNTIDWTPAQSPTEANFSQKLLDEIAAGSVTVAPATYLVSALKPMQDDDIVSSASSHIYSHGRVGAGGVERAKDQDAVVTYLIETFESVPDNIDVENLVLQDSFLNNAEEQGFTFSGGRWYTPEGAPITPGTSSGTYNKPATGKNNIASGDSSPLGMWFAFLIVAAICLVAVGVTELIYNRRRTLALDGKAYRNMQQVDTKKVLFSILFALFFAISFPLSAYVGYAAPEDNITVEYRYNEGETIDVPDTMTRFDREYKLLSASNPVRESSLPITRTYNYKIDGAITPAQLATIQGLGDVKITPVDIVKERSVDVLDEVENLPNNDVENLPERKAFPVSSATADSGTEMVMLERAGIEYTVDTWVIQDELPDKYKADVVYRGIETYNELGYYLAETTYTSTVVEGSADVFVVVAVYEPTDLPAVADPNADVPPAPEVLPAPDVVVPDVTPEPAPIPEPVPEPVVTVEGLSPADQVLIDNQVPTSLTSPIQNIVDGNTPLGNGGVKDAWSVLSLFISMLAVIFAIVYLIMLLVRRSKGEMMIANQNTNAGGLNTALVMTTFTFICFIITPFIWLMVDNLSQPQVWINTWTPMVVIPFVIGVVLFVINRVRNGKADEENVPRSKTA